MFSGWGDFTGRSNPVGPRLTYRNLCVCRMPIHFMLLFTPIAYRLQKSRLW